MRGRLGFGSVLLTSALVAGAACGDGDSMPAGDSAEAGARGAEDGGATSEPTAGRSASGGAPAEGGGAAGQSGAAGEQNGGGEFGGGGERNTGGQGGSDELGGAPSLAGSGGDARARNDAGAGGVAVPSCEGAVDGGGAPAMRHEAVQCYLSEPHTGDAACLAPDAERLVELVSDYISGCGFASQFVMEASEPRPVPIECEALIDCCEALLAAGEALIGLECIDGLDAEAPPSASYCGDALASYKSRNYCQDVAERPAQGGSGGEGAGGVAAATPARSLCCYRTCGYTHCT